MPKRNLIWIVAIVAAASAIVYLTHDPAPRRSGQAETDEFSPVGRTYHMILDRYCRPIDAAELRSGAVEGMAARLDEFSSYIPPDKLDAFERRIMGKTRGLGLRLAAEGAIVRIVGPLIHSPAHRAGIMAGDILISIDRTDVSGRSLDRIAELLAGEVDTSVELTIERVDGWRKTFSLTRGEFPIETVQGLYRNARGQWVYLLDEPEKLTYVRIREFVGQTGAKLREILQQTAAAKGLVLDLRDNPGGMLREIEEVCDLFLSSGVIGTSVARGHPPTQYLASPAGTSPDVAMVILINARTASAAEIIAGALRLHGRAVLIGTRTRGKGCVQSMFPLPSGLGQVNLTTAELLIGTDRPITRLPGSDVWGVDPHGGQEVPITPAQHERLRQLWARAEVISTVGHDLPETMPATAPASQPEGLLTELLDADSQLSRAVELLSDPERYKRILELDEARRRARALRRERERVDANE